MRQARVFVNGLPAGILTENNAQDYRFTYDLTYLGAPISLTMPVRHQPYLFNGFPSFFEGLLFEGVMLDALLRHYKLDKDDYFSQLVLAGEDLVGAVTVQEIT